jgi:putative thioredoxin
MLGPVLEKLIEERQGEILLAKVDIDRSQDLAARYRIDAIPAVLAFREGKPVLDFVGVLPEAQLRAFLDRLIPSETDQLARRAAPLEAQQPATAEALYRQALQLDDRHQAALLGLVRLLLGKGDENEAAELLGRVSPAGETAAEVERLTAIVSLRQTARDFGDEASARRRLQADSDNARRRYELGCILAAAGRYPEALELLLSAAEADRKWGAKEVREAMVKIFQAIGTRSELADQYRDRLARVLY